MSEYQSSNKPDLHVDAGTSRLEFYNTEHVLDPTRIEALSLLDIQIGDVQIEWMQQNHFSDNEYEGIKFDLCVGLGSLWHTHSDSEIRERLQRAEVLLQALGGFINTKAEDLASKDVTTVIIQPEDEIKTLATIDYNHRVVHVANYLSSEDPVQQSEFLELSEDIEPKDQLQQFGKIMMQLVEVVTDDIGVEARVYAVNKNGEARHNIVRSSSGKLAVSQTAEVIPPSDPEKPRLIDIHLPPLLRERCEMLIESRRSNNSNEKWQIKPTKAVLFYGEPGNGKTTLGRALANEIGAELTEVSGTDIHEMWVGKSAAHLKTIFNTANDKNTPQVLLFDEMDLVLVSGNENTDRSVIGIFKQQLDSLKPHVFVIGTTNDKDSIDKSLIRPQRFTTLYLPNPDFMGRAGIFMKKIESAEPRTANGFRIYDKDVNIEELAHASKDMTGAQIVEALERARLSKVLEERRSSEEVTPITTDDIRNSMQDLMTD